MRLKKPSKIDSVTLYPITVEPHEEGGYFASCPLFQGCHAEGDTMGEAISNVQDVMHIRIEAHKKI